MKRKSFLVAALAVMTSMILPTTAMAGEDVKSQTAEVIANLESHFEYSVDVVEDIIELSEKATVKLVTDDPGSIKAIEWVILKDGAEAANAIADPLSTEDPFGGLTKFLSTGDYTVVARITDKFGVKHEPKDNIKVTEDVYYRIDGPTEAQVGVSVPEQVATNNPKETKTAEWTLEKDGKPVKIEDYIDGPLDVTGGTIKFKAPGEYDLKGSFTDTDGVTRPASKHITVTPADGSVKLTGPDAAEVNDDVPVGVDDSDTPEGVDSVEWSLEKDGKPVNMGDYIEGDLDVDGGTIKFKAPGENDLIGKFTDKYGNTWTVIKHFSIKDKPAADDPFTIKSSAPRYAKTGDDVGITIIPSDPSKLASVDMKIFDKDGKELPLDEIIEGSVGTTGGTIKFKKPGDYTIRLLAKDKDGKVYELDNPITVTDAAPTSTGVTSSAAGNTGNTGNTQPTGNTGNTGNTQPTGNTGDNGSGSGNGQPTGNGNSNNGNSGTGNTGNGGSNNGSTGNNGNGNTNTEPGVLGVIRLVASSAGDSIADFLEDNVPAVLGESRTLTEDGKVVETRDNSMLMLALAGMAAALVGLGVYSKRRA